MFVQLLLGSNKCAQHYMMRIEQLCCAKTRQDARCAALYSVTDYMKYTKLMSSISEEGHNSLTRCSSYSLFQIVSTVTHISMLVVPRGKHLAIRELGVESTAFQVAIMNLLQSLIIPRCRQHRAMQLL